MYVARISSIDPVPTSVKEGLFSSIQHTLRNNSLHESSRIHSRKNMPPAGCFCENLLNAFYCPRQLGLVFAIQILSSLLTVSDPGRSKSGHGPHTVRLWNWSLQQRNKRVILGNILNYPFYPNF